MMRRFAFFSSLVVTSILISSCSINHTRTIYQPDYGRNSSAQSSGSNPPADIHEDICKIYAFDRKWQDAAKASERKWGTPEYILLAFIHQESKFVKHARPSYRGASESTSYGYSQAQEFTWKEYQDAVNNPRAKRTNIYDSLDFIGWYNDVSNQRNNIPKMDAQNLYLAYHEGNGGFERKTYQKKPWLIKVSKNVQSLANSYKYQLSHCR